MAGLSITFSDISSSGSNNNTYNVTANLYISGNGVSYNSEDPPYWIWVGAWATTTQWVESTANFTKSTSAQFLGSLRMTFTKGQSEQTVTINGQYNTDTSDFGNLYVSKTLKIPAGTYNYTITYDKNGATSPSGAIKSKTVTYGNPFTANPATTPTKTNYELTGWLDPTGANWKDFSGTWIYTDGTWGIENKILSLKAQWTPIYKITYNANGGTGTTMSQTSCTSGKTVSLSKNTYTKPGYGFMGWSTDPNSEVVTYTDQAPISINANITLYAVWTDSYSAPIISNAKIVRCYNDGTENIAGEYIKVIFEWQAGITGSSGPSQNMSYTIGTPFNINENLDTTTSSGGMITTSPIMYSLGETAQVSLSLIDGATDGETTTQTLLIPEGALTMHINSNGTGIRFFGVAKEEDKGLYIEDTNVGNWIKAPYLKEVNTTVDTFYIAEQDTQIGNIKVGFGTTRGGRRGIWDYNTGKWLLDRDGNGLANGKTFLLCGNTAREIILADQVIETGDATRGSGTEEIHWYWKKYQSGTIICHGYTTRGSIACTTASGVDYYSSQRTVNFPTNLFPSTSLTLTATAWSDGGYFSVNIKTWTNTYIQYYYRSGSSVTKTAGVAFYAIYH